MSEIVSIVGHGPNLLKNEYGQLIDSADFVVRQKRGCMQYVRLSPECFGTKTHAIVGSFLIYNGLPEVKDAQYWIYTDSRLSDNQKVHTQELTNIANYYKANKRNIVIDKPLCDMWDDRYRQLAHKLCVPDSQCKMAYIQDEGEHYHPHTSSGFKAIIYTAHLLNPKLVRLFGYDSMQSGEWTWSVTRGPQWAEYPNHAWKVERNLLDEVSKEYGVKFEFVG
ncbi:MAG: hypothetical protein ACREBU_09190 [Nitrososphaera sp.]